MKKIYFLENSIKNYDWGSTEALSSLLGTENKNNMPQAELWMGVHSAGESFVEDGRERVPLGRFLAAGNAAMLGEKAAARFHGLPFLFKVLAADKPLSIQVHPTKQQAEAGFARENAAGIALNAFNRNYKDSNHKPEILCALSDEFWMMCGFKTPADILAEFTAAGFGVIRQETELFAADPTEEGFKKFFTALLQLDKRRRTLLVDEALRYADYKEGAVYQWVAKLAALYPEDAGVLAPLYLNTFSIRSGQAVYLDAGIPHAYLQGVGVELMSNSDNVLRGGLTSKHVDIPELLNIIRFVPYTPAVLEADSHDGSFKTPSDEFILQHIRLEEDRFINAKNSCQLIICTKGKARLETVKGNTDSDGKGFSVVMKRGDVVLVPYAAGGYILSGKGELFAAVVPKG
jgi:mannose-6-phosphate isomerase